jgi:hypothetical protein
MKTITIHTKYEDINCGDVGCETKVLARANISNVGDFRRLLEEALYRALQVL